MSDQSLSILGTLDFRGRRRPFGISQTDRLTHIWVLGKSGQGKSTLVKNLIYGDLLAGRGLMLVDPHGDLVQAVLDLVPERRIGDVVYFNPADTDYPIAFNPLDRQDGLAPHLVASGVIAALKKTWPTFWGPRMDYILRTSLLTLLAVPGTTLLDVHRLLVDAWFRKMIVAQLRDTQLLQFWQREFPSYGAGFRTEAVSPILNKTGQYLTTPFLRNIVGQERSAFSFRQIMDGGGVFFADLARGRLGEDLSSLLGALLVTQVQLAALTRTDIPEPSRRNFVLYIDEAQVVLTQAMVDLLPEARKFHLGLVLAHQYLDQLEEPLRYGILGNAGTLLSFRLGARDAVGLTREFGPEVEPLDLMSLSAHHAYVRLAVGGSTSRPFSAHTLPDPTPLTSNGEAVKALSRKLYTRPVAEIDEALKRRWLERK